MTNPPLVFAEDSLMIAEAGRLKDGIRHAARLAASKELNVLEDFEDGVTGSWPKRSSFVAIGSIIVGGLDWHKVRRAIVRIQQYFQLVGGTPVPVTYYL